MTRVYRLTRKPFAANPFDGEGAFRFGGRWSRPGTRLVYTAENLSLAMLEYLAHLDSNDVPDDLVLASAGIPDPVARIRIKPADLPKEWTRYPAPPGLAVIGDRFVRRHKAAVLVVPSALAPVENNWLLNPNHLDFAKIRVFPAADFEYDSRLIH